MAERYGPHISRETIYVDKYLSVSKTVLAGDDSDKFINPLPIFTSKYSKDPSAQSNPDTVFVFNLVDNDNARRTVHHTALNLSTHVRGRSFASNYIVIDIGNEETYGQLYSTRYMRRTFETPNTGFDIAIDISDKTIFDYIPSTISNIEEVKIYSCADADVDIDKQDQFLVANDTAATLGHNWFVSYLMSDKLNYPKEVKFISAPNIITEIKQMTINPIPLALVLQSISNSSSKTALVKDTFVSSLTAGWNFENSSRIIQEFEGCLMNFAKELVNDDAIFDFLNRLISD